MKNRLWQKWMKIKNRRAQSESKASKPGTPKVVGLLPQRLNGSAVPGSDTIVDSVISFLRRFVFLKDEPLYLLVALWVIATYLCREFDYAGYLLAYSPEPQSGKTTLLDLLDLLVASSSGIQIAPTPAILFRTANGKTQLLDEIDTWMNHEELRSVLNAGFQKGAKVSRMEKDPESGLKAYEYSVYGPKALAGIGLSRLSRATRDRTFALAMVRQMKGEKRERLRRRLVNGDADALRKRIEEWARDNRDLIVRIYHEAKFPYLNEFSDRTMDIADPLAAVLEAACKGDSLLKAQEKFVQAIRETRNEQHSQTPDHKLLRHLLTLAKADDPLIGGASELAKACGNLAEPPNEYTVGQVLRKYGFKSRSTRKPGEDPKYRYVLSRNELQEVVDRWAGQPEEVGEVPDAPTASKDVVAVVGS